MASSSSSSSPISPISEYLTTKIRLENRTNDLNNLRLEYLNNPSTKLEKKITKKTNEINETEQLLAIQLKNLQCLQTISIRSHEESKVANQLVKDGLLSASFAIGGGIPRKEGNALRNMAKGFSFKLKS